MNFELRIGNVYKRLIKIIEDNPRARYIALRGGTSSGKTIAVLQYLLIYAIKHPNITINIITESMVKAKRGIIPDFRNIVMKELWSICNFNKTESVLTFPNQTVIRFISAEDIEKVVGLRSDILYADEVNTIKLEVMDQLSIRTRYLIIASWNPISMFPWYEKLHNKFNFIEDVSTYKDNPYLEETIINDLLERGKQSINFKRVYIDGEFGSVEGLIFKEEQNWQIIDKLPDVYDGELWGLDFGFTNDPTVLIQVRFVGNDIYVDEWLYKTNLINSQIANEIKTSNTKNIQIIADSAEPKTIADLKRTYGINVKPIKKEKILYSIDNLLQRNVFVTVDSLNVIKEFRNYSWHQKKKDSLGRTIPMDEFNHAIDALRYVNDVYNKPKGKGKMKAVVI